MTWHGIQWHGFFTHKNTYFWSVRTISVRKIAEVDIARHTREVVSRFLKSFSNERNNKMLILPVICKSSVVPVENYSKICEVVTLTHLREFFRQLYSLLLHLKVRRDIRSKFYQSKLLFVLLPTVWVRLVSSLLRLQPNDDQLNETKSQKTQVLWCNGRSLNGKLSSIDVQLSKATSKGNRIC